MFGITSAAGYFVVGEIGYLVRVGNAVVRGAQVGFEF
jgi:preprotein translocase subunit Sss1